MFQEKFAAASVIFKGLPSLILTVDKPWIWFETKNSLNQGLPEYRMHQKKQRLVVQYGIRWEMFFRDCQGIIFIYYAEKVKTIVCAF